MKDNGLRTRARRDARSTCRCRNHSGCERGPVSVPLNAVDAKRMLLRFGRGFRGLPPGEPMSDHVYKSLELTGSSAVGIEDAVNKAIAKASETVRNIQWFSVVETRGHVQDGKVAHWQVTVKVGFTLE
jgi:dodecin